jgi:hypothetical protein
MALLHNTLEQLRDRFADVAKLGRIDTWLAEEPVLDPEEVASEDWRPLSLIADYRTLSRWPIELGTVLYRRPPDVPVLADLLRSAERLDFADPPGDGCGRIIVLNEEGSEVSIPCGAIRQVRIAGDAAAAEQFGALALAAGELVHGSLPQEWKWFQPETTETSDPVLRWIFALFELAWARVPNSGLAPSVDKTWRFPKTVRIGSEGRHRHSDTSCRKPLLRESVRDPSERAEPTNPRLGRPWWYSEITDLSLASVFAINVLLDVSPDAQATGSNSQPRVYPVESADDLPETELPYELIPPIAFSWKGQSPIELTPLQWKLLSYCLKNRRVDVQKVADHLWGSESSSEKSESAIDSAKSKLNTRLSEAAIPITLSRKAGWVICSIEG